MGGVGSGRKPGGRSPHTSKKYKKVNYNSAGFKAARARQLRNGTISLRKK